MTIEKVMPEIAIFLDKERHLKASMGAFLRFKKETGRSLFDRSTVAQMSEDLKARNLTEDIFILIWACLRHEDKNLTLEQVEDMILPSKMEELADKLFETFEAAMPENKPEGEDKEPGPLASPPAG